MFSGEVFELKFIEFTTDFILIFYLVAYITTSGNEFSIVERNLFEQFFRRNKFVRTGKPEGSILTFEDV